MHLKFQTRSRYYYYTKCRNLDSPFDCKSILTLKRKKKLINKIHGITDSMKSSWMKHDCKRLIITLQ